VDRAAVKLLASAAAAAAEATAEATVEAADPSESSEGAAVLEGSAGNGPASAASAASAAVSPKALGLLGLVGCAAFAVAFGRQLGPKETALPADASAKAAAAPTAMTYPAAEMRSLVAPRHGQYQHI
jgi:hypothetical protein